MMKPISHILHCSTSISTTRGSVNEINRKVQQKWQTDNWDKTSTSNKLREIFLNYRILLINTSRRVIRLFLPENWTFTHFFLVLFRPLCLSVIQTPCSHYFAIFSMCKQNLFMNFFFFLIKKSYMGLRRNVHEHNLNE